MYSRAPRSTNELLTTPFHIGPGTYDHGVAEAKQQSLDSYAPFASLSLRDDIFTNLNEVPGPGQYNLNKRNIGKGGSSLMNREARFPQKREEIPGPGAYTIPDKENKPQIGQIKISKQRVKFNRKKNAPSIQDPKNAYGFEESHAGELIPQAPPERDPSLGPAYYPSAPETGSQYKGAHFGKYTSKRTNFSNPTKTGPGPGEYDIEPVQVDIEHYHMKNMAEKKAELNVPRYSEALVRHNEKESIPGPGKYETKRLFDDALNKEPDIFGLEPERPPFGVQAKRFGNYKTVQPGPGAYNEQRTALNTINKLSGLKKTPFLQSSTRFEGDEFSKARSAPGPGQYRLNGFSEEIMKKALIEANRKPAFGQSAQRKFNLTKKEEFNAPGPAQYQIREKTYKPRKENATANFASNTKHHEIAFEDTPGPTAYDVPKAYENLINTRREAPRNKNALKRQESFNVVSKRDVDLQRSANIDKPGPGSYDQQASKSKFSIAKQTDRRWKESKDKALPGPGFYELSPMYQDTLLKGTFNATLTNPFVYKERQKQSQSESAMNLRVNALEKVPEQTAV